MANIHGFASRHAYSNDAPRAGHDAILNRHAHEAYGLPQFGFVIVPIVAGIDKCFPPLAQARERDLQAER